jgi:hypothetical protein
MYPWITKGIQESFHTLEKSKILEKLNPIKLDNKDLHGSIGSSSMRLHPQP